MNLDFSRISPEGYAYLVASLVATIVLDYAVVRVGLDFLKPTSRQAFLVGRVGKIVALIGWMLFFNNYWFPSHLGGDQPMPGYIPLAEWVIVGLALLFAFTTYPRPVKPGTPAATPGGRGLHA